MLLFCLPSSSAAPKFPFDSSFPLLFPEPAWITINIWVVRFLRGGIRRWESKLRNWILMIDWYPISMRIQSVANNECGCGRSLKMEKRGNWYLFILFWVRHKSCESVKCLPLRLVFIKFLNLVEALNLVLQIKNFSSCPAAGHRLCQTKSSERGDRPRRIGKHLSR